MRSETGSPLSLSPFEQPPANTDAALLFEQTEIFDIANDAVPSDASEFQCFFDKGGGSKVEVVDDVREGGRIGEGQVESGVIGRRWQESWDACE